LFLSIDPKEIYSSQKAKPMYNRDMTNNKHLKSEFVRITTPDGLELHGLLFEPKQKTTQTLIHIHGWVGNFYERKYIDHIAKVAVSKGFAFLTFNNRGAGIISDFIKRKKIKEEYVRIGGSLEKFDNCIKDIKAAVDFLKAKGYKKIILEGHSLGCQKAVFYKRKTKDSLVKGLILLAPVDDYGFTKALLKSKHKKALEIAKRMVKNGQDKTPVPEWMAYYPLLSAQMFVNVTDPNSSSGKIFNYSGKLTEIKSVDCPILAVFGSEDEWQADPGEKLKILEENVKDCDIELVQNAGHRFIGFEEKLSKLIGNWIKNL
jgi:pimeloyl-ACP methyl ester carboxylesterase